MSKTPAALWQQILLSKIYFLFFFGGIGGDHDTFTDAFRVTRCSTYMDYTDDTPLYKLNFFNTTDGQFNVQMAIKAG